MNNFVKNILIILCLYLEWIQESIHYIPDNSLLQRYPYFRVTEKKFLDTNFEIRRTLVTFWLNVSVIIRARWRWKHSVEKWAKFFWSQSWYQKNSLFCLCRSQLRNNHFVWTQRQCSLLEVLSHKAECWATVGSEDIVKEARAHKTSEERAVMHHANTHEGGN